MYFINGSNKYDNRSIGTSITLCCIIIFTNIDKYIAAALDDDIRGRCQVLWYLYLLFSTVSQEDGKGWTTIIFLPEKSNRHGETQSNHNNMQMYV